MCQKIKNEFLTKSPENAKSELKLFDIIFHLNSEGFRSCQKRKKESILGGGCGSVYSAVASDTRGLQFESSHWQTFI